MRVQEAAFRKVVQATMVRDKQHGPVVELNRIQVTLLSTSCTSQSFLLFFHGTLRLQIPYGLLGTGEEWDGEMRAQAHLPVHTAL